MISESSRQLYKSKEIKTEALDSKVLIDPELKRSGSLEKTRRTLRKNFTIQINKNEPESEAQKDERLKIKLLITRQEYQGEVQRLNSLLDSMKRQTKRNSTIFNDCKKLVARKSFYRAPSRMDQSDSQLSDHRSYSPDADSRSPRKLEFKQTKSVVIPDLKEFPQQTRTELSPSRSVKSESTRLKKFSRQNSPEKTVQFPSEAVQAYTAKVVIQNAFLEQSQKLMTIADNAYQSVPSKAFRANQRELLKKKLFNEERPTANYYFSENIQEEREDTARSFRHLKNFQRQHRNSNKVNDYAIESLRNQHFNQGVFEKVKVLRRDHLLEKTKPDFSQDSPTKVKRVSKDNSRSEASMLWPNFSFSSQAKAYGILNNEVLSESKFLTEVSPSPDTVTSRANSVQRKKARTEIFVPKVKKIMKPIPENEDKSVVRQSFSSFCEKVKVTSISNRKEVSKIDDTLSKAIASMNNQYDDILLSKPQKSKTNTITTPVKTEGLLGKIASTIGGKPHAFHYAYNSAPKSTAKAVSKGE